MRTPDDERTRSKHVRVCELTSTPQQIYQYVLALPRFRSFQSQSTHQFKTKLKATLDLTIAIEPIVHLGVHTSLFMRRKLTHVTFGGEPGVSRGSRGGRRR